MTSRATKSLAQRGKRCTRANDDADCDEIPASDRPTEAIARVATAQRGSITKKQLLQAGLESPEPRFNVPFHRYELNALWQDRRLVIEVDGYGAHGHRAAFERDRRN
jgi:hypothetical protein